MTTDTSSTDMKRRTITIQCVAEGSDDKWNAICLNFDLAVQGSSFNEVDRELREAILLYLEAIKEYPKEERARFLNRKAPLLLRAKYACLFFLISFLGCNDSKKDMHSFVEHAPCPT